jgi:hypothetical protein
VEASILATYPGVHLPERWRPGPGRDASGPSLRRLLVLVRHLPPGSAVEAAVHPSTEPEWGVLHQLVDDTRQCVTAALGVKEPAPHPLSPHARRARALTAERAAVLEAARRRAESFNNR